MTGNNLLMQELRNVVLDGWVKEFQYINKIDQY